MCAGGSKVGTLRDLPELRMGPAFGFLQDRMGRASGSSPACWVPAQAQLAQNPGITISMTIGTNASIHNGVSRQAYEEKCGSKSWKVVVCDLSHSFSNAQPPPLKNEDSNSPFLRELM